MTGTVSKSVRVLGLLLRLLLFCCGALLAGLSVGVCAVTGFGADPITVFYEGLSKALGVTQGQASNLTAIGMVLLTLCIDWRQLGVGTLLGPFFMSAGIDLLMGIPLPALSFWLRVALLVVGLLGIGFGIACQIFADFGCASYEALSMGICGRLHKKYVVVRWVLDALLLSGMLMGGRLTVATVVAALLLGKVIVLCTTLLKKIIPQAPFR